MIKFICFKKIRRELKNVKSLSLANIYKEVMAVIFFSAVFLTLLGGIDWMLQYSLNVLLLM